MGFAATTLVLITFVAWFAGCGDDDPVSQGAAPVPEIAGVSPADGATGVARSTTVTVRFDMPMDPQSVMQNFYVSGGDEMHEWMDSLTYHYHHHHGDWMMDMDHMMEWMDDIHIPGEFHWNDAHDACEFVPSPSLEPDTDYMLFVGDGVCSDGGVRMDMRDLEYRGFMYHFHTAP